MNWLNKLERKFGRYAVPNLIVYLIGAYSVGFVLNMVAPNILGFLNVPALLHFTRTDLETYHMDFNADRQQYHFSVDHDDVLLSAWNCVGARVGNFPF